MRPGPAQLAAVRGRALLVRAGYRVRQRRVRLSTGGWEYRLSAGLRGQPPIVLRMVLGRRVAAGQGLAVRAYVAQGWLRLQGWLLFVEPEHGVL